MGPDGVVPFALEGVTNEIDRGHLGIGDGDAGGVARGIEFAADAQPSLGRGGADQIDDDAVADQWFGAPIRADERKEAVLDLVPFSGAGRQVVDLDVDAEFVGQMLEFTLPQRHARADAATTIGGDDQAAGLGVALPAHLVPPATDRLHRELGGIVIDADADPAALAARS